jgi:copper chaperone CopZ
MEKNTQLDIKGMTCGGCVASVKRVLEAVPGVKAADVTLANGKAAVRHDDTLDVSKLKRAVEEAGFEVV